jgi:hypothetical protein
MSFWRVDELPKGSGSHSSTNDSRVSHSQPRKEINDNEVWFLKIVFSLFLIDSSGVGV